MEVSRRLGYGLRLLGPASGYSGNQGPSSRIWEPCFLWATGQIPNHVSLHGSHNDLIGKDGKVKSYSGRVINIVIRLCGQALISGGTNPLLRNVSKHGRTLLVAWRITSMVSWERSADPLDGVLWLTRISNLTSVSLHVWLGSSQERPTPKHQRAGDHSAKHPRIFVKRSFWRQLVFFFSFRDHQLFRKIATCISIECQTKHEMVWTTLTRWFQYEGWYVTTALARWPVGRLSS